MATVLCVAMQEISLSMCVWSDGWFNLFHTDYSMCNRCVQPHPAPDSSLIGAR